MQEPSVSDQPLRIGELARVTGKTIRTLHFYEELGLLSPVQRTPGGFRLYGPDAQIRIHWIERLKDMGFALAEIKIFLDSLRGQESASAVMASLRDFYARKLEEATENVRRFQALERELKESLTYLDSCRGCSPDRSPGHCPGCAETHGEPPPLVAAIQESHSPFHSSSVAD